MSIPYNPTLREKAKLLRKNSTLSEVILWKYLKGKQRMGLDFNRQKPIDSYILDFYNNKHKLCIEIDGTSHENKYNYDRLRNTRLAELGVKVLHIDDRHIKNKLPDVIDLIDSWIKKNITI